MPVNLVSLILQYLTPEMIAKIASALGLDRSLAGKAITAIIPSILAGFAGSSAKPDGARMLADLAGKQDPNFLKGFADMLGGASQSALVSNGSSMLGSLLGGGATSALTGAVGKFAGIGDGPTKSLLGMLAPVVMGQIGSQATSGKLDAGGIASLLAGQRDNVAKALPAGFADLLAGSGLLDSVIPATTSAVPTPTVAATRSTTTAARPAAPPAAGRSTNWLPWLAALAAALVLGWYFYGKQQAQNTLWRPGQAILVDNVDLGKQITGSIDGLRTALGTVKDEASARAALPRLQEAAAQIDRVGELSKRLSPDTRKGLGGIVATAITALRPIVNAALGATGAGPVLKSIVDGLMTKLEALAKS